MYGEVEVRARDGPSEEMEIEGQWSVGELVSGRALATCQSKPSLPSWDFCLWDQREWGWVLLGLPLVLIQSRKHLVPSG